MFLLHGNLLIDSLLIRLVAACSSILCSKRRVCLAFISSEGHQLHIRLLFTMTLIFECVYIGGEIRLQMAAGKTRKIGNAQRH